MPEKSLYVRLAESVGAGGSPLIPRIFQLMADEDEARVLLAASPPAAAEEIAAKTGLTADKVRPMLEGLFAKGLVFTSVKPDATRYYRVRHVLQFHDATAIGDPPREVLDLWKEFMAREWSGYLDQITQFLPGPPIRVIPLKISLTPQTQVMAFDDVDQVIQGARRLAVTKCSCRVIDGACGKPIEVCLQINKAADYNIQRGTGRELTKEEALEIIKKAEEAGLVHVGDNSRSLDRVICNCCGDCCMNWPGPRDKPVKFVAPSRFTAAVSGDQCTSCETCVEACPFQAIAMTGENETALVLADKCMGCGVCVAACPVEAIALVETRPEAHVPAGPSVH
ncbi:MAG: 4Fe-4S binding protein [Thermodesulfobacteriota bacterium]